MIKQIILGMGAAAGMGGLLALASYRPQPVPVVAVKPTASALPTTSAAPNASATPPPTAKPTSNTPTPAPSTGAKMPTPTHTPATTNAPTPTLLPATPSPTPSGPYIDGTYNGSIVQAGYGISDTTVQVHVTASGGHVTGVSFLHIPTGDAQTNINSNNVRNNMPSETISAQVANVQVVSGATQTSNAYISSMTVALAAAHV